MIVREVCKRYRSGALGQSIQALHDISFTVSPGETVALIGESGCGKSTLARLILGLEPCDSGEISCLGIPVSDKRRRKRLYQSMQPVFQDSAGSLNPRMKVCDQILEPLRNFARLSGAEETERLAALAAQVELPIDALRKYPHELSGGQQRRVLIARAISIRPGFLIMDEALSGIDATIAGAILELIQRLQRETGCGLLFITHDLEIALHMAIRILVMRSGRIVEHVQGATSADGFSSPYAKQLFKSSTLDCLKR